jgi:hypothetical protein
MHIHIDILPVRGPVLRRAVRGVTHWRRRLLVLLGGSHRPELHVAVSSSGANRQIPIMGSITYTKRLLSEERGRPILILTSNTWGSGRRASPIQYLTCRRSCPCSHPSASPFYERFYIVWSMLGVPFVYRKETGITSVSPISTVVHLGHSGHGSPYILNDRAPADSDSGCMN